MSSVGFGEDHRVDCLSKYERESELSGGVSCGAESSQKSVADCRMTRAVEEDMFDRVIRLGLLRLAGSVSAGSRGGLVLQLTVMFSGEVATSAKASAKLTDGSRLETQKVGGTWILLAVEQRCVCFVRRVERVTPVVVSDIRDCIIVFGLLRVTSYRRQQAVQPEGYSLDKLRMC